MLPCLAGCGFRTAPYEAQARIEIEVQSPDASTILSNEVTYLHALAGSMFTNRTQVVHYRGTTLFDVSVFGSDAGVVSNHCYALISRYTRSHRNDIRVVVVEAPHIR
jgi:hypothetical protein